MCHPACYRHAGLLRTRGSHRQKKVKKRTRNLSDNGKKRRTREASAHASSAAPSAADIHDLLAAITMLEKKRDSCLRRQVPATRPATEYKNKSCQSSKRSLPGICHYPRHITKILDALARLCVSRAKHEVIATALRVDPQARSVELIVAANGDVSMNILNHLKEMRTLLRRISSFIIIIRRNRPM